MSKNLGCLVAVSLLFGGLSTRAQFSISPLASFGGGDGWLSPGEGGYAYLTTGNTERGLAYANGHLYLSSRAASGTAVRILNPQTGAELGVLDSTGITGGTFALSMLAAGGDGAIYAANLTVQATTSPFKVYRWAAESSAPVLAYSGTPIAGGRVGDTLAASGSGGSTRLVAGFGSSPGVTGGERGQPLTINIQTRVGDRTSRLKLPIGRRRWLQTPEVCAHRRSGPHLQESADLALIKPRICPKHARGYGPRRTAVLPPPECHHLNAPDVRYDLHEMPGAPVRRLK